VQRPFTSRDGGLHTYLIHPPGGIAGGDELELEVMLQPGARVLLTTPAATKFYRVLSGRRARLEQRISVTCADLEWLPQENIYFRGASARTCTRIDLHGSSRFLGWEINCFGRPAVGETFDAGQLSMHFELWRDHNPLLIDRQNHDSSEATRLAPWSYAGHAASGCLLAYPCMPAHRDALLAWLAGDTRVSLSLVDSVLACRVLADQGETVRILLAQAWRLLRPGILGSAADPPRIWNT
jgi:urease accessory protein